MNLIGTIGHIGPIDIIGVIVCFFLGGRFLCFLVFLGRFLNNFFEDFWRKVWRFGKLCLPLQCF